MGSTGPFGWWVTIIAQWANVIGGNIGLAILAGQALKGVYILYDDSDDVKLPEWIIIAGCYLIIQAILIPDLHYLRYMAIIAGGCSIIFCFITIGISSSDGARAPKGSVQYNTGLTFNGYESTTTKVFNIMGALSSIAFAYSTVIIPEIQATIRDPPVQNFYKSLIVTYGFGAPIFLVMSFVGFWAYGADVDPNLLNNLSGPKWAITVAWLAVFIQSVVSLQIYSAPIYETIDTAFGRPGGPFTVYNILIRIVFRVPYIVFSCFFAALLPFFGDFIALIGALTVLPLNFVVTFLLTVEVNKPTIGFLNKMALYFGAVLFAVITVASAVASIRYIVIDSINYSVFADN
jgi:amino acid permease